MINDDGFEVFEKTIYYDSNDPLWENESFCSNPGHIYLIREREFLTSDKPVYKLGRTSNAFLSRMNNYPKGSEINFVIRCADCVTAERELLYTFGQLFPRCLEYGREYFWGNIDDMGRILGKYFFSPDDYYNNIVKSLD